MSSQAQNGRRTQRRSIDTVKAGLARRYAAERRFRAYGIMAIVIGLLCVAFLFITIFANGYTAFQQTYVKLDVHFDPARIDPDGDGSPNHSLPGIMAVSSRQRSAICTRR